MARQAQLASGEILEFPDETPDAVMDAAVKRHVSGGAPSAPAQAAPQPPARIGPVEDPTFAERYIAPVLESLGGAFERGKPFMAPPVRAVADIVSKPTPIVQGLADPAVGATQLAFEAAGKGDMVTPAIRAQEAEYQQSRGADAGTFDLSRTIASVLNPMPIKAASAITPAAKVMGRVRQGAAAGGVSASAAPVYEDDFWGHKAAQAAGGTVFGAGLPAASDLLKKGSRAAFHVIEPYLPGGIERIAGRTANKVAGDKADDVVRALEENKAFVSGSRPIAGEAAVPAGSAEFAALGREMEKRRPSEYLARDIEQNKARVGAVRDVGRDKAALEAAKAARSENANKLYKEAYDTAIRADPQLAQISGNPYFQQALPRAMTLAKAEKLDIKRDQSRFMHLVKVGMDAELRERAVKAGALEATERKAREDVKKELVDWLGKKNPAYEKARSTFSKESTPINQMEIGQALEKRLVPALSASGEGAKAQRATEFAAAVQDAPKTIKTATGGPRFEDFKQAGLTDEQISKVEGVVKDLSRSADYEEMGRRGAEAARKIVGENLKPHEVTGMFSRTVTIFNAIVRRIEGGSGEKAKDKIAELMLDPKEMARVMKAATEKEREGFIASLFGAAEKASVPTSVVAGAATGKAAGGDVPDAPRDPKVRHLGKVYRTPRGPMEWSENGWLTIKK